MKKLKLGTRVLVNGVETFISELHADIERGVYKVRTSNPTYEFTKNSKGEWWAYPCEGQEAILLEKAPKYGNYQVGDRVKVQGQEGTITSIDLSFKDYPIFIEFKDTFRLQNRYTLDGESYIGVEEPCVKKLRVKLGDKR